MATRQCTEYAKLGMMGVTFIYASGDGGVAGGHGECLAKNGSIVESGDPAGTIFSPVFPGQPLLLFLSTHRLTFLPASCPYVTAVGATQIPDNGTIHTPEIAANFSSGGFSNIFGKHIRRGFTIFSSH